MGAHVQSNLLNVDFSVEMRLFDVAGQQIGGPLSVTGFSDPWGDGTSPFLGASVDSQAISRVLFAATSSGDAGVIINALQVNEEMVPNPEPATLLLLGTGLGLVAYRRLRVRRS